jgi:hypothetical protein
MEEEKEGKEECGEEVRELEPLIAEVAANLSLAFHSIVGQ